MRRRALPPRRGGARPRACCRRSRRCSRRSSRGSAPRGSGLGKTASSRDERGVVERHHRAAVGYREGHVERARKRGFHYPEGARPRLDAEVDAPAAVPVEEDAEAERVGCTKTKQRRAPENCPASTRTRGFRRLPRPQRCRACGTSRPRARAAREQLPRPRGMARPSGNARAAQRRSGAPRRDRASPRRVGRTVSNTLATSPLGRAPGRRSTTAPLGSATKWVTVAFWRKYDSMEGRCGPASVIWTVQFAFHSRHRAPTQ
jgi:hypothetical protein